MNEWTHGIYKRSLVLHLQQGIYITAMSNVGTLPTAKWRNDCVIVLSRLIAFFRNCPQILKTMNVIQYSPKLWQILKEMDTLNAFQHSPKFPHADLLWFSEDLLSVERQLLFRSNLRRVVAYQVNSTNYIATICIENFQLKSLEIEF